MKKLIMLLFVLSLSACSMVYLSSGRTIDRTHLDDIKVGAQDKAQIKAWFGEPSTVISNFERDPKGCVERWEFKQVIFKLGKVTHSEFLFVSFDKDGKVCNHDFTEEKLDK